MNDGFFAEAWAYISELITYSIRVTPSILGAAGTTTLLFLVVILLSIPIGFIFTLMAKSRIAPLRWVARAYIYIVRGTPLLLQLLFVYFGIPLIFPGLKMERFTAAIVGFILNYAAYFAEIFRGGLLAIDKGQYEAAQVLGFTRFQTTVRIILPQMLRVCLPSVTNEAVTLVKDTALLYSVAVPEILHMAKVAVNRDARLVPFVIAGVIYLVMNTLLSYLMKKLEDRFRYQ